MSGPLGWIFFTHTVDLPYVLLTYLLTYLVQNQIRSVGVLNPYAPLGLICSCAFFSSLISNYPPDNRPTLLGSSKETSLWRIL